MRHFHGYYWDYLLHLPVPVWVKRKVKFGICRDNKSIYMGILKDTRYQK
ncbi:hypothetical protein BRYFOR_05508 [Marvinbryantia formatexigens DSM 14469]|uniref:Uncharacterized protein n=1 Tax=Marvinbryantia formatexigens DSM 14469 TaxID=478749 RepID=C6LA66_9FIRM|nr:hypothetical protein BRYFOR_05508 [Marvinbryantia formatexigens DSM 14469]